VSTSCNEILKKFIHSFGQQKIINDPIRKGDISHSLGTSTKIYKHIGFKPKTNFSDGIEKTFSAFKADYK
jgi:nucleoside-diphosphate-sugar epimerase